jgi:hypothetical protein
MIFKHTLKENKKKENKISRAENLNPKKSLQLFLFVNLNLVHKEKVFLFQLSLKG